MTSIQGTFTILFTDLEGSTDLRVREGDVVANEIIQAHDELVRSRLEIAGAVETKALGDGFMALFSSAGQAIQTAVSIQSAIADHNQANPGTQLSVRIGLNSGDVTQSEGDAHGTAVHAAARIADKAEGGQILASQIVHDVAGTLSEVKLADRGLFWLKGFPDRWRLFEVLWRDRGDETERVTRETKAASAAAFDPVSRRSQGPVIGRSRELEVVRNQLAATPSTGLRSVVLEGEAGIGKTRLLEASAEIAAENEEPFWVLEVSADEELRGPFLLFRSLLSSPRMAAVAREAVALESLERAQEAIFGRGPKNEGLSAQEQMLSTFDEVAGTILALTRERPLLLMFDDLQWADDDSIQLIRYLVRTVSSAPLLLLISLRPYSDSASGGASKLIADLDRMQVTQVLRLQRLTRRESAELLENLLGAAVDQAMLDSLHSRSEGVPFFLEELARAYREAEALQLIDGTWTMTKLSGPAVPSSIQSLVERRLAQLSEECRDRLADAGVLGRRFRLSDLARTLTQVDGEARSEWELGEDLKDAIDLGLIVEERAGTGFDLSFSHDQIRASLLASLPRQRRRAIHGAIAQHLAAEGGADNLSMLAYHALQAGDAALAVSSAVQAAQAAMEVSAPEEAIRLVDATLPAAAEPLDRIEMLRVKDDALAVLERGVERMANLAEMTALTGAAASPELDAEVKLRRASAARANEDYELALDLAKAVRSKAEESGDLPLELAACFEVGQAITRCPIGEGYWLLVEIDLDVAAEPYGRALEIAREIGAREEEADALRELAVIEAGRVKLVAMRLEEDGMSKIEILMRAPELFDEAKKMAEEAFEIYDEIGDQRGAMSALISMAYSHVTDPTAHGMAGRIEHIRSLHNSRNRGATSSQAARDDALMLYAIHAYARHNLQPDLALQRGREAYDAARAIGDRWLETLAAGGMAMARLLVGDVDEAGAWVDRAATAAMSVASTAVARRTEMWRGAHAAARRDKEAMERHFLRAADLSGDRHLGECCEAWATLAIRSAELGVLGDDEDLLEKARSAADRTLELAAMMKGKMPWAPAAHAALSLVAAASGEDEKAADEARAALDIETEGNLLWVMPIMWAAARALILGNAPESASLSAQIIGGLSFLTMSMADPELRGKWFDNPIHREVAEIVGFDPAMSLEVDDSELPDLTSSELELLRDIASGPMAGSRGRSSAGTEEIGALLEKLGVDNENEAVQYAIKSGVTWL